jgi:hypothetical protein
MLTQLEVHPQLTHNGHQVDDAPLGWVHRSIVVVYTTPAQFTQVLLQLVNLGKVDEKERNCA